MEHAYFGCVETSALDGAEVVWKCTSQLGDHEVEVQLWAGPSSEPGAEELDAFAACLTDLPALDTAARTALRSCLHEDRYFIDYHVEALEDSDTVVRLVREAAGEPVGADAFAAAMRLRSVGLWLSDLSDGTPVVLDYMFDPELSDQILAVKLTPAGTVASVDWES
ncbi:DUF2004 domain-containing protein [Streptomyces sp. JV185]|uniref:DUF2004 domain-containing protein n=1 Tax=Streptomyces sp. JV185 TaxID=858638 RepID=UPI002E76805E|nr:DUF2004 domain-containing protein [Streptomyces sp. JV185]MEE1773419.1 DUF2004 domain-containing protein [Streptomyces sp. JV185]